MICDIGSESASSVAVSSLKFWFVGDLAGQQPRIRDSKSTSKA